MVPNHFNCVAHVGKSGWLHYVDKQKTLITLHKSCSIFLFKFSSLSGDLSDMVEIGPGQLEGLAKLIFLPHIASQCEDLTL